jgi:hypothetical protein
MDVSSVAGAASLMQSSQTQQALSASMIKQNADSQNQIAQMVQQNSQTASQPLKNPDYGFSTTA